MAVLERGPVGLVVTVVAAAHGSGEEAGAGERRLRARGGSPPGAGEETKTVEEGPRVSGILRRERRANHEGEERAHGSRWRGGGGRKEITDKTRAERRKPRRLRSAA